MVSQDRGNNKAIILGYDEIIVSPISTKSCTYCLAANEVEALLALVEYLFWITRWESNSGDSLDLSLIHDFANDLDYKLMTPCCDDIPLSRFTSDGVYQQSDDGGVTWHDAPSSDPRNQTIGFPPLSGDDGDTKKCVGANSIITYFKNSVARIQTAKDNEATAADISAILVGILLIVGVVATGGWLFAFIGELIALIYANVTAETWAAAFDDPMWQDLVCAVFDRIEDDGSFTVDGWDSLIGYVETSSYDPIAVDYISQMIKGLGYTGLSNVSSSNYGGALDCLCIDACSTLEDWTEASVGVLGTIISRDSTSITVASEFYSGFGEYVAYINAGHPEDFNICCTCTDVFVDDVHQPGATEVCPCGEDGYTTSANNQSSPTVGIPINVIGIRLGSTPGQVVRFVFSA